MKIIPICPESFASNTYALISSGHALIVDPSVSVDAIKKATEKENAIIDGIILTHGHFDHVLSMDELRAAENVKVYIHKNDSELLTDGRKNAFYEFFRRERAFGAADVLLSNEDTIRLGEETVKVIHTPGHTEGSVCYLADGILVTGDTLFAGTIGRCDLYGGNDEKIRNSLSVLRTLPTDLMIYPGHGSSCTLGYALDTAAYYL
ncbi:MAG: MBL fold metallo-hydrolase [Clostridia bacterium]|nr:MBL fold metallo-hydrolase [Clostridia bacterium]